MDQDSIHMVTASKVHMLKPGEYELWRMRMEQYIQMNDYSLWEVINNGNAPTITKVVKGVETIIAPTTAEEKAQRRLELKARSTLLMGIPNEHQLKFNYIKDAKSLLQAIKKRFKGNAKESSKAALEIHGESISQEDVNQKFLRSLSPEWNTHTIQPNSPQLNYEDLQQINPNDLEEMDLRWQNAMLTIRARRFLKNTRRKLTVNGNETIGFDNDQAEEGPTNFALVAYCFISSNSKVSTDSNCSSSCLENVKILKEQNEQLLKDLRTSKLNAIAYKIGLKSVEARLLVYKKNESVYEEDIKVLNREIHLREVVIIELRRKFELAQKQKDEIQLIVENFENLSKNLSKLIDCQIVDKCKTGLGYNAVPPPYTGNFMPPKPDLSFSGLEEFTSEPIVIKPIVENSEAKASIAKPKAVRKNNGALIIKDWVSDNEEDDAPQAKIEKKTFKPSFVKIDFVKAKQTNKTDRKTAKHFEQNRQNIHTPRGNQRNWNNMMSQRLGSNFEMFNKACYVCESFGHLQVDCKKRVNAVKDKKINTTRPKEVVNAARPKAVVNAVKGNNVNADKGVIDSGCSRHMTWNMSYLTNYKEIDGGYVAFRGNLKGGKITSRDKEMNQFCERKGIKREFSVARTPQQNGVVERKNKTLIEAGRIMLADSKLPTTFWAKAVNTACYTADPLFSQSSKSSPDAGFKPSGDDEKKVTKEPGKEGDDPSKEDERDDQEKDASVNSTNNVNVASTNKVNVVGRKASIELVDDPNMPALEDIVYLDDDEDVGTEANMNNLDAFMPVSPIPTTRIHKDHP
ncbi:ribonuclease H-like domain-containing protein, partial [Tanacetum coccineum]